MKQQINETKRLQQLASVLTETDNVGNTVWLVVKAFNQGRSVQVDVFSTEQAARAYAKGLQYPVRPYETQVKS